MDSINLTWLMFCTRPDVNYLTQQTDRQMAFHHYNTRLVYTKMYLPYHTAYHTDVLT